MTSAINSHHDVATTLTIDSNHDNDRDHDHDHDHIFICGNSQVSSDSGAKLHGINACARRGKGSPQLSNYARPNW